MAELNPDEIFTQVRTAHRMVVAYYKRLFPQIQSIADQVGMEFYHWKPSHFGKPARSTTNILQGKNWEWDLVPGVIANYLFFNAENSNKQMTGEWMLDFHVITDTGVTPENRKGNQDPLELSLSVEDAKSVLRIYIWIPAKENSLNWLKGIWQNCNYPPINDQASITCLDESNHIYGSGFEIPLSALITNETVEDIALKIEEYKNFIYEELNKLNL